MEHHRSGLPGVLPSSTARFKESCKSEQPCADCLNLTRLSATSRGSVEPCTVAPDTMFQFYNFHLNRCGSRVASVLPVGLACRPCALLWDADKCMNNSKRWITRLVRR